MSLLAKLNGYKTYLAVAGLIGLAIFQFSTGQIPLGLHTLFLAMSAAGIRGAIADLKP